MLVVVADDESRVVDGTNTIAARLANSITWLQEGDRRVIIAIGAPSQWNSSHPLPATAVSTDLVQAALSQPDLAIELWGPFLSYLVYMTKPNIFRRTTMAWLPGVVPVTLELRDGSPNEVIARSLRASSLGRKFRIINTA